MTQKNRQKWIRSYKKANPPHWATSLEPSKLAKTFVSTLLRSKLRHEPLLEIGCGNGRDSLFFYSKGFDVTGIDISAQALVLAKKNKEMIDRESASSGHIVFKKANAEKLPFPDESFGNIYSIGVLHSSDLRKSMKEIARVLKPGGIALIHVWQKTLFLNTKKLETLCTTAKLLKALKNAPVALKNIKENITTRKIDTDENKKNPHLHYAIIFSLKKPTLRKTAAAKNRKGK